MSSKTYTRQELSVLQNMFNVERKTSCKDWVISCLGVNGYTALLNARRILGSSPGRASTIDLFALVLKMVYTEPLNRMPFYINRHESTYWRIPVIARWRLKLGK